MEDKYWLPITEYLELIKQYQLREISGGRAKYTTRSSEQSWQLMAEEWLGTDLLDQGYSIGTMLEVLRNDLPETTSTTKLPAALEALNQARASAMVALASWQPAVLTPLQPLPTNPIFPMHEGSIQLSLEAYTASEENSYRLVVRLTGKLILGQVKDKPVQTISKITDLPLIVTDRYGTFKSTGNEQLDSLIQPLVEEVLAKLVPYKLNWYYFQNF